MRIPDGTIVAISPKAISDIPLRRPRTEVDPSTCRSGISKQIRMTERKPKGAMSTHTQTGDSALRRFRDGTVIGIYPRQEILNYVTLHPHGGIGRRIKIPTVEPGRTDNHKSMFRSQRIKIHNL